MHPTLKSSEDLKVHIARIRNDAAAYESVMTLLDVFEENFKGELERAKDALLVSDNARPAALRAQGAASAVQQIKLMFTMPMKGT